MKRRTRARNELRDQRVELGLDQERRKEELERAREGKRQRRMETGNP